jgi:hypothetical protein
MLIVQALVIPAFAGDSISADIIAPGIAAPGDTISFDVIVRNYAPAFLDHCNYFFSVSPYVDLIQDCFGNPIDDTLHLNSISDTLAVPPPHGENHFFTVPVLGKIRSNAPPNAIITSSFWLEIISNQDQNGDWCAGCWADSSSASKSTVVDPPPLPAPEFPGVVIPAILLAGLVAVVAWGKKQG